MVLRAIEIGLGRDSTGAQEQLDANLHVRAFVKWAVAEICATHEISATHDDLTVLTQQELLDKLNALPVEGRRKITSRDVKLFFKK
jgi:hypothetical protein